MKMLASEDPAELRMAITIGSDAVGALVVRQDWLLGPYLRHLSIAQSARGQGLGAFALLWLENYARDRNQRNIWLCVSEFNTAARRFYTRHHFETMTTITDLVVTGENEILMRRQLPLRPL